MPCCGEREPHQHGLNANHSKLSNTNEHCIFKKQLMLHSLVQKIILLIVH